MNTESIPAPDNRAAPGSQRPRWSLVVGWCLGLIGMTILGIVIAFFGAFLLSYLLGMPLARYGFQAPVIIVPLVWMLGIVAAWLKHRSIALAAWLAVAGVVVYVVTPVTFYLVVMVVLIFF